MKKILITLLITAIAAFSAFYVYNNYFKDRNLQLWDLVPNNSVLVYEIESFTNTWNYFLDLTLWKNLQNIKSLQRINQRLIELDSLTGRNGNIDRILQNNQLLISMHPISSEQFDFIFYLELPENAGQEILDLVIRNTRIQGMYKYNSRDFLDHRIYEINQIDEEVSFSYFIYHGYFVGSYTPFLIEDVIRNLEQNRQQNFQSVNSNLTRVSKIGDDEGNLYFDLRQFPKLLKLFTNPETRASLEHLDDFGASAYADLTINNDYILLNGGSYAAETDYLNIFKGQQAKSLQVKPYISNRTAALFHYTFSDTEQWQQSLENYWQTSNPASYQQLAAFEKKYNTDAGELTGWMGGELALGIYETVNPDHPEKILFVQARDLNEGLNRLNRLSEKVTLSMGDTLYREEYAGVPIVQLDLKDFPETILGPVFGGFETCFYAPVDRYILISNDIQALKNTLVDIESEYTWGKSVKQTLFLDNTLQEANLSVYIDLERAWNQFIHYLEPSWKTYFSQFAVNFKRFEKLAVQFRQVDEHFINSVTIKHQEDLPEDLITQQFNTEQEVFLESSVITKPFVVRNHIDRSFEVLVQDSLHQLYLISKEGEILWKRSLPGPVRGEISQIDYFRNGKLQYLLATLHAVHLLDRNGNSVENYPIDLADTTEADKLAVIDYDNSKRYRFLLADQKGNVFMYDKDKQNLEGWQPKHLGYQLTLPPQHFRVRGKDCIMAIEKRGEINLLNRRGEYYEGFPYQSTAALAGETFINFGADFENSMITTVNNNGEILKLNFNGKMLEKEQLYKPTRETSFKLFSDALKRTFIIARQDYNRLSILDQKGELIFEKDYLNSDELKVQFYFFSTNNKVYAITDQTQDFTYIYDQNGELINYQPLESGYEIALIYSENESQYKIYSCFSNKMTVYTFFN